MSFLFTDSLKNLVRHRKRYLLLGILLFGCTVLSGFFITSAIAAKQYLAENPFSEISDELLKSMRPALLKLDSRSSLSQAAVLLVSAAALIFSSSAAVGERLNDVQILRSLGLTSSVIAGGLLIELTALSLMTQLPAYIIGRFAASAVLHQNAAKGVYPAELLSYIPGSRTTLLGLAFSLLLLLIPAAVMISKLIRSDVILKGKD